MGLPLLRLTILLFDAMILLLFLFLLLPRHVQWYRDPRSGWTKAIEKVDGMWRDRGGWVGRTEKYGMGGIDDTTNTQDADADADLDADKKGSLPGSDSGYGSGGNIPGVHISSPLLHSPWSSPPLPFPLIIHQTYISEDLLPPHWSSSREIWSRTNPDWEYRFHSDESNRRLIEERYPEILEIYDG